VLGGDVPRGELRRLLDLAIPLDLVLAVGPVLLLQLLLPDRLRLVPPEQLQGDLGELRGPVIQHVGDLRLLLLGREVEVVASLLLRRGRRRMVGQSRAARSAAQLQPELADPERGGADAVDVLEIVGGAGDWDGAFHAAASRRIVSVPQIVLDVAQPFSNAHLEIVEP